MLAALVLCVARVPTWSMTISFILGIFQKEYLREEKEFKNIKTILVMMEFHSLVIILQSFFQMLERNRPPPSPGRLLRVRTQLQWVLFSLPQS
jgi:hypothetical protein